MKFSVEKRDITPSRPVYLAGFGSRDHKSEGVLQPITARTVLLQANKTLLIIALDVIGADRSFVTDIKTAMNERFGLAEDEILINTSHTHTSVYVTGLTPELRLGLYSMGRDDYPINESALDYSVDEEYFVFLRDTLLEMVAACCAGLCEGELRVV